MKLERRIWPAVLLATILGCERPDGIYHAPTMHQYDKGAMSPYYEPMITNAAAHDMSVADIHFFPHTTALNDLGVKRLHRLLPILERFGGTVRYETSSTDQVWIDDRLASVRDLLVETGIEMSTVTVAAMMSGGRGMTADDAIRAKENAYGVEVQGISEMGLEAQGSQ